MQSRNPKIKIRQPLPDIAVDRVIDGFSKMQEYLNQKKNSDELSYQIDMQFHIVVSLLQSLNKKHKAIIQ